MAAKKGIITKELSPKGFPSVNNWLWHLPQKAKRITGYAIHSIASTYEGKVLDVSQRDDAILGTISLSFINATACIKETLHDAHATYLGYESSFFQGTVLHSCDIPITDSSLRICHVDRLIPAVLQSDIALYHSEKIQVQIIIHLEVAYE